MWVDSLTHLDDIRLTDVHGLLARADEAGVEHCITAGYNPLDRVTPWVGFEGKVQVWEAVGLHPRAIIPGGYNRQLGQVERALRSKRVVAMGEIGLDARPGSAPIDLQVELFRRQLDMATRWGFPVIIHCVKAVGRLIDVLYEAGPYPAGGMIHGFSGPPDLIRTFLDLNFSISFGGLVTDRSALRCTKSVRFVPNDRLLIETDTPDRSPAGFEGEHSEPAALLHVAQAVAALRSQSVDMVQELTHANACRLFRFGQSRMMPDTEEM